MLPKQVLIVRHGKSEGNEATDLSEAGNHSVFTEEFCNRHSSLFRLTEEGRKQAISAGEWIKQNFKYPFYKYYTSPYLRAIETAGLLSLPGASWQMDMYLRERGYGLYDVLSEADKAKNFPEVYKDYKRDPFYWAPPNGESLADLCLRVDRVLDTLHRECSSEKVILVCHGMVMRAFIIRLERLTPKEYLERTESKDPRFKIRNCQILQYSRVDPENVSMVSNYYEWTRSVCPYDFDREFSRWRMIERKKYSNEELLDLANQSKSLIV